MLEFLQLKTMFSYVPTLIYAGIYALRAAIVMNIGEAFLGIERE